jgi:hypothetical protein
VIYLNQVKNREVRRMLLTEDLKIDMKRTTEQLKDLDEISQIIICSKIEALYERQMIDEQRENGPRKAG